MVQEGDLYHDVSATRCDWSLPMIYQSTRHMDDVTGNLCSWFCSTWRAVLKSVCEIISD